MKPNGKYVFVIVLLHYFAVASTIESLLTLPWTSATRDSILTVMKNKLPFGAVAFCMATAFFVLADQVRIVESSSAVPSIDKAWNITDVSCALSSPDMDGKTSNEKAYRGVIRRLWEKEAATGSDGAVTIIFDSLAVGAGRAWRPTATDAYSHANPRKPIYSVRASFTTCTDYRTAISKRKMERIYDCFTHKTGGLQCTQTGASGPLALKDKKEYIQKKK